MRPILPDASPCSPEQIDAARILELASFGDPDARLIARRCAETLPGSSACSATCSTTAGRGVGSDRRRNRRPSRDARERATDLHLPPPDLVVSTMGADVVVRGAICAASTLAVAHALDVWTAA
ncbi:MAG: hypothetical protein IPL36_03460 [Nigerium sp.]|nr:hypothetical protein [Nigerium sp.]